MMTQISSNIQFEDSRCLYRAKKIDIFLLPTDEKSRKEWKQQIKELNKSLKKVANQSGDEPEKEARLCSLCGEAKHAGKIVNCPNRAKEVKKFQDAIKLAQGK